MSNFATVAPLIGKVSEFANLSPDTACHNQTLWTMAGGSVVREEFFAARKRASALLFSTGTGCTKTAIQGLLGRVLNSPMSSQ